jgi:hypothetical protein
MVVCLEETMFMSMSKWGIPAFTLGTTGAIFSLTGGLMIYLCTISHRFYFAPFLHDVGGLGW